MTIQRIEMKGFNEGPDMFYLGMEIVFQNVDNGLKDETEVSEICVDDAEGDGNRLIIIKFKNGAAIETVAHMDQFNVIEVGNLS